MNNTSMMSDEEIELYTHTRPSLLKAGRIQNKIEVLSPLFVDRSKESFTIYDLTQEEGLVAGSLFA